MSDNDPLSISASLVQKGDPDRFLAAMAAPVAARGPLLLLAAFNLEIARAPWITKEPMIAQMRLQFWRDVINSETPAGHELAGPLQELVARAGLSRPLLLGIVDARETEIGVHTPFETPDALWRFLEDGAGALMALGVEALGGPKQHAPAIALGAAQGLANYLLAIPALEAAGKKPLPDGRAEAVADLARGGLARAQAARRELRGMGKKARPALLAAWRTEALLSQAARDPVRVGQGTLGQSEFARKGSLVLRSFGL